jgi:hypothetical protein
MWTSRAIWIARNTKKKAMKREQTATKERDKKERTRKLSSSYRLRRMGYAYSVAAAAMHIVIRTQDIEPTVKRRKKELYALPNREEQVALRETENLFHTNIVRLQVNLGPTRIDTAAHRAESTLVLRFSDCTRAGGRVTA